MAPLVSVIIPTFNRKALLQDAIQSVRNQTYAAWELVVADDGSTDGTRAYLEGLRDERVQTVFLTHTGNAALVRNRAARAARGTFLALLDSDDLWNPDKLARQMDDLGSHSECHWSYTGTRIVDRDGREIEPLPERLCPLISGWILEDLLTGRALVTTSTVVVERGLFERADGFDETLLRSHDIDLWMRLAEMSACRVVSFPLVTWREHAGNRRGSSHVMLRYRQRIYDGVIARSTSAHVRALCERERVRVALEFIGTFRRARQYADAWKALRGSFHYAAHRPEWWTTMVKTAIHPVLLGGGESRFRTQAATPSVEERLARFAVSRHARELWPEVSQEAFGLVEREFARVISLALNARHPSPPIAMQRPAGIAPETVGIVAFASGVGPLLGYWCETDRVTVDPATAALLRDHLEHGRQRAALFRERIVTLLSAFSRNRIEVGILKGTHTAYAYFPDPGTRVTSDLDLLVRPADLARAREALGSLGFDETRDRGNPDQTAWSLPSGRMVYTLALAHAEGAWSVDLHTSLDRTAFHGVRSTLGTPDLSTMDPGERFWASARTLGQPRLLAYLALHASSHFYTMSLIRLVELVLVIQHDFAGPPERWAAFDALIANTATARFVFPALDLAERLVPGTVDPAVLARIRSATPPRLRRIVQRMTPASAQRLHPLPGLRERFVWVASAREALAALAWLAWPRHGDRLATPFVAVGMQWRRVRKTFRRIMRSLIP